MLSYTSRRVAAIIPTIGISLVVSFCLSGCWLQEEFEVQFQVARLQEKLFKLTRDGRTRKKGRGRGVVVVGGANHHVPDHPHSYTLDALLCIAALRRTGSRLPVELWHDGDAQLAEALLPDFVTLRSIRGVVGDAPVEGYQLPSIAMLHSGFEELLYMDADNIVLEDPAPLFEISEYTTHGVVFWPDFESFQKNHKIWRVTGQPERPMHQVENGQLLIHRDRHWKQLELAAFFSQNSDFYFHITHGDKDLLMMAFLSSSTPFHLVETPVGALGYTSSEAFCGHTMLQYHPRHAMKPLFAHRNLLKFSANLGMGAVAWLAMKPGRSVEHLPGGTPLIPHTEQHVGCKCDGAHYRNENWCTDLSTEIDNSESAQERLSQLQAIELDMLELRSDLHGGAGKLKSQWWVSFSAFLRKQVEENASWQASSSSASWLASYLHMCVESLRMQDLEFATISTNGSEMWSEHPHSNSGKHIRCLAEHPQLTRIAVFFYGYPGPNRVFSAALGLKAKIAAGGRATRLFTAEAHPERCSRGKQYLAEHGMSEYVNLTCDTLCERMADAACMRFLIQHVCPGSRLDFLSIDFALGVPPTIYRSVLKACSPMVVFVENSGMDLSSLPGRDDESHSNYSEHSPDSWHRWEEEELHPQSASGLASHLGSFRLVVDRQLSRFDAEVEKRHWAAALGFSRRRSRDKPRRFSVYVSASAQILEYTVFETIERGNSTPEL